MFNFLFKNLLLCQEMSVPASRDLFYSTSYVIIYYKPYRHGVVINNACIECKQYSHLSNGYGRLMDTP